MIWWLAAAGVFADTYRLMTFNTELSRKGPGLLVRDLMKFEDPALRATLNQIAVLKPDILVLQSIDYDHNSVVIGLVKSHLKALGLDLPYHFAKRPNSGLETAFDLDRDGLLGRAKDKQSFGLFSGQGGIVLLSRYPIDLSNTRDFSTFLWYDLPDAALPQTPDGPYYTQAELDILRLHAIAAWDVAIELPDGMIHILTSHTSPPVFDGPENRNGLRNNDELKFWRMYIQGWAPEGAALRGDAFVLMGDFNNDPQDGDGLKPELLSLLSLPSITDPMPQSEFADATRSPFDTVAWPNGPGNLRVDYILPSRNLDVVDSGVAWPPGEAGSRHSPVWIDIRLPMP